MASCVKVMSNVFIHTDHKLERGTLRYMRTVVTSSTLMSRTSDILTHDDFIVILIRGGMPTAVEILKTTEGKAYLDIDCTDANGVGQSYIVVCANDNDLTYLHVRVKSMIQPEM